jgi:hypothetical protein
LQQGVNEAKIVEQAQKLNMPLPETILNKPELSIGLDVYRKAFWDCSTDRNYGMAEGPIPWSSVSKWAERYGYVGEEFDRLWYLIRAMDSVFIEHRNKAQKKAMKQGKKSAPNKSMKSK